MKTCSKCGIDKSLEDFAWKSKVDGTKNTYCKACHRKYSKKHYVDNTEKYKAKARKSQSEARKRDKKIIVDYLLSHPCAVCGEDDIDVLEFDHIEMVGQNAPRVASLVGSQKKLMAEIEKCQVLCANCHTKRTRQMLGTSRKTPDMV